MSIKSEVHPIQASILKTLLYNPGARFTDLNVEGVTSDHFNFHIKKLVELKLIEREGSSYRLTATGKEFANRFDTDTDRAVLERQAKLGVVVVCVRGKGEKMEYLVQQRLKEPYYGFYGFLTGKIKWGETVSETAARELKEETGLEGSLVLIGIKHKMDYDKAGKLLEDKFFYVFKVTNTKGALQEQFPGGRNMWFKREDIFKLPDLFDGVDETLKIIESNELVFIERKYTVQRY